MRSSEESVRMGPIATIFCLAFSAVMMAGTVYFLNWMQVKLLDSSPSWWRILFDMMFVIMLLAPSRSKSMPTGWKVAFIEGLGYTLGINYVLELTTWQFAISFCGIFVTAFLASLQPRRRSDKKSA